MSVRVNLLPDDVSDQNRRSRQLAGAGVGVVVLAILLVGAWFWQSQQVDDARVELAAEEEELQQLRAELAELNEFAELRDRRLAVDAVIAGLMAGEFSLAGLMQDIASVMPPDVELATLSVDREQTLEGEEELGTLPGAVATVSMSGATINSHAPGLERLLLDLDKLAAFRDPYFSNSTLRDTAGLPADMEVNDFALEFGLGREALTRRYAAGLPEGLR